MEPLFTFVTLDHVIIHLRHVAVTVQLYLYICELVWVLAIVDLGKDVAVFKSSFSVSSMIHWYVLRHFFYTFYR